MHHHGPECHARRLVCCLQVQGLMAHIIKYDFLPYLLNCWPFCNQIYLNGWYIFTSWNVLCKIRLLISRSRTQCRFKTLLHLCILCFLYHLSLGNPARCVDLLLLITKLGITKWACTESSTLTYSITRHTGVRVGWRIFAVQGNKPSFFLVGGGGGGV